MTSALVSTDDNLTPAGADRPLILRRVAEAARAAARVVAKASEADRTAALHAIARAIEERTPDILAANARDVAAGHAAGLAPAMLDRLTLDATRVAGLARAVTEVAGQPTASR